MVKFEKTEKKIKISQLQDIENMVGLKFPEEYKNHLLKYNGGKCKPNIFSFSENGKISESRVDWFLAIYKGEDDNLRDYIEMYKLDQKRVPIQILPVAHDPLGNLICICCAGDDKGCVYFWDHENEVDYDNNNDDDYSNLYLIEKSFDRFLAVLR